MAKRTKKHYINNMYEIKTNTLKKVQKYIKYKNTRQQLNKRNKRRHIRNNNALNIKLVETTSERPIENKLKSKLTQIQIQDKYTNINYRNRKCVNLIGTKKKSVPNRR